MQIINCKFDFQNFKRKKGKSYDPDQLNDIEKRAWRLHERLQSGAERFVKLEEARRAEIAKQNAIRDNIFIQNVGELLDLNKVNINRFEQFLANRFNLKAKALGLSPDLDYTPSGKLRENIVDVGNVAKGMLEEKIKMIAIRKVKEVDEVIQGLFDAKRITDKRLIKELKVQTLEEGQIPRLRAIYNIPENADRINMQRYQDYVDRMKSVGFNDQEIREITAKASEITATMDEARAIANSFGLEVGNIEGLGYMARVYTPDAKRYIDHIKKAKMSKMQLDPQKLGFFNTNVAKSRNTFHYIPEDDAVVAYQLGLDIDELHDLMEAGELTKWMHENVSDDLLENMTEVGSIYKLPMTTMETYEFMVNKFSELPFKGMDEMFITDPTRITEYYMENLKHGIKESAMARTIIREGTEKGWAVPASVYNRNPEKFKDYVRLDADSIRQYYPGYKEVQPVYVSKYVDDTWKSVMGMSSRPGVLGTFAQAVQYMGSFFNQSLLLRPGYPMRILYDSFRNFFAAGGNALRFTEGWTDLIRITGSSKGVDLLDNTKKIYKGLDGELITERQLYDSWIKLRGTDFAPMTSGRSTVSGVGNTFRLESANPFNFPKAVNYIMHYTKAFGGVEGAKAAFDMFKGAQGEIFDKVASFAAFMEASTKWGLVKSLADTRTGNKIGQYVTGIGAAPPDVGNLREILRHTDDYFPQWDAVGDVTEFFNAAVRPFSVFAMFNPPAQIRQAMRRPREFVNYWRIKNFLNQQSGALEDEDLNDATVPDFIKEGAPQFLSKDKDTGEWIVMLNNNWDARAEAFDYIQKSGEDFQASFGMYVGSTETQRDMIENGKPGLKRYMENLLAEGQPVIRNVFSILSGYDVRKGREISRDPSQPRATAFNLPYEIEYILTAYPPIQNLVDSNPRDIFGRPEFRDPKTGRVIIPAKEGIFGSRRVDFDISQYRGEKRDMMVNALRFMGFNMQVIDVGRQMQYSFKDSKRVYEKTKSDIGKLRNDLTLEYLKNPEAADSPEFQRRLDLLNERVVQMAQLHRDTLVIADMMQQRGIKPTESFDNIDRDMLRMVDGRIGDDIIKKAIDDLELMLTKEELRNNASNK